MSISQKSSTFARHFAQIQNMKWKIPLAIVGAVIGIVLVLLATVVTVLCVSPLRQTALDKGVAIANDKTDWDIDLGRIYLSPFHHSPMKLYRLYKGEEDLPVTVEIDSLFVGHRGQDTLIYVRALRLNATLPKSPEPNLQSTISNLKSTISNLKSKIYNIHLLLDHATFHSDSLIATVGVDAIVNHLEISSPAISIAKGTYPLHGLRISGADVGIDLRPDPNAEPDTIESTPLLLAFDLPDADLDHIHFRLTPLNMGIDVKRLITKASIDVGANCYDAKHLDLSGLTFSLGNLRIPVDTVYGAACADIAQNIITSDGLYVRSDEIGAKAKLTATRMNLNSMRVQATADAEYQGSKAQLKASYAINAEEYDADVHIERVNLAPFLKDSKRIIIAGDIQAAGQGINPKKPMTSHIQLHLNQAIYESYDLSGTDLTFATDTTTSLRLKTRGFKTTFNTPMPLFTFIDSILPLVNTVSDTAIINALTSLRDLTVLDTIRRRIPELDLAAELRRGSPAQQLIEQMGLDIKQIDLSLTSNKQQTGLSLSASIPDINHPEDSTALRLPAVDAAVGVNMTEGQTDVSLTTSTQLTDGAMNFYGLCTDAALQLDVKRNENELNGDGRLTLDSISYGNTDLGSKAIDFRISPSQNHEHALRADVRLEDIPLGLVNSFVNLTDIALHGAIRASASVDGLPRQTDISAEVKPIGVSAKYTPYDIGVSLGETPIIMAHNHIDFNGLPIYGVDSTFISLKGGLDIDSMLIDITLDADSFAPVKLAKNGPIPVYGDLATDIHGRVYGPLDSIVADVAVTLLPVTDITYPIDKKNLAQVKPYGTVRAQYAVADGALNLGGQINIDDGFIRYSPKIYPVMPFHVDSGSHIAFNGPIGRTMLNVSASQEVKADVESKDEDTRRVDFRTGVRVQGEVDSIGLNAIGFFLEAPDDEPITRELASLDENTREGLAATLLATGMYVGESNVAAQRDGYALSSIINSRINAAMANSKLGKHIDVDISSGQSNHATGRTNDMNIAISKSFFKDRLRISVGSTISDNPEINETTGLFSSLTADYRILPKTTANLQQRSGPTPNKSLSLRIFSQRDYNNILEGELYKSGLAVHTYTEWRKKSPFTLHHTDSITRTYSLTADAGVAYRSNNSIGPDLTLKASIKNLIGNGESFTLKGNGAYYWALRNRHPGDPKKTDTYKLGVNASLVFPYLHWGKRTSTPDGDTRYMLGYQYENIAGGYGVHKFTGSFTYFIRSPHNQFITHAFTPFSLSVVLMKAESEDLLDKAAEYPQLIKVIAGNEFVPSIGYNFIYDNYRSKHAVNTFLNLGVKESGNLINAIYCAFGRKWSEQDKPLGKITYNQFVKLSAELHNRFNFTEQVSIATRLFAGANIPLGNSYMAPLSEAFYAGGPNSLRASSPYAYGPGNFYSLKYNQNFFHAGDVKLEANVELRFPIVWKLFGAAFVDAGNVWNWYSTVDSYKASGYEDFLKRLQIPDDIKDGIFNNPEFAKQIALGTGAGLRLDIDGLVVRLDIGVGIHAPYQTYKYDKDGKPDTSRPITTYFNIPSALDAIRVNFGIGYPF